MNRVVRSLLVLFPACATACAVYDADLVGQSGPGSESAGGGDPAGAGGNGAASGSGARPGASGSGAGPGTDGGHENSSGGSLEPAGGEAGEDSSAGSGGEAPQTYTFELLDDFEDQDGAGYVEKGRNPVWYLYQDESGGTLLPAELEMTAVPSEDAAARPDSEFLLFVSSTGFTTWGSGVGVDFVNPKAPYDASAYAGIRFYAKVTSSDQQVRVNISDASTDASAESCVKCDDHFGKLLSLTTEWREYRVLFDELRQEGWGDKRSALELEQALGIQFLIKPKKSVDLWIDELSLMLAD